MSATAESLGTFAANEAVKAGGDSPFDENGDCLLPVAPQEGDWDFLADQLQRAPSLEETGDFAQSYRLRMLAEINQLCD